MNKTMRWLWKIEGEHVSVRVYMNGALCGNLIFREREFHAIRAELNLLVDFIEGE